MKTLVVTAFVPIPWDAIEDKYENLFLSKTGMTAKPLRRALGSLMIQKQYGYSDRELLEQIIENPYYQFFIGLPGFQSELPFVPSLLAEFCKQLNENKVHTISNRIVCISQPYIRPIVRGKVAFPVEFGAIERYRKRTEHYLEGVLVDKIYCNRENLAFCKLHGTRLFGSSLDRSKKNAMVDKKTEYIDNADRIEVERTFSLAKRCQ